MSTTISGNGEIDTPNSDKGLDIGGMLSVDNFMHVQDQKATTVNGGASVVGIQIRDLNTVLTNTITGASLSTNQTTLPAGDYFYESTSSSFRTGNFRGILYNVTDASNEILGKNGYCATASSTSAEATIRGVFTLASPKTLEVRMYCGTATASIGLGLAVSDGNTEVYSDVKIWKVG